MGERHIIPNNPDEFVLKSTFKEVIKKLEIFLRKVFKQPENDTDYYAAEFLTNCAWADQFYTEIEITGMTTTGKAIKSSIYFTKDIGEEDEPLYKGEVINQGKAGISGGFISYEIENEADLLKCAVSFDDPIRHISADLIYSTPEDTKISVRNKVTEIQLKAEISEEEYSEAIVEFGGEDMPIENISTPTEFSVNTGVETVPYTPGLEINTVAAADHLRTDVTFQISGDIETTAPVTTDFSAGSRTINLQTEINTDSQTLNDFVESKISQSQYNLPPASTDGLGGIKLNNGSGLSKYQLPVALNNANEAYVDITQIPKDTLSNYLPQLLSLPSTSESGYNDGDIVQYIGDTVSGGYTNGYIYKASAEGTVPGDTFYTFMGSGNIQPISVMKQLSQYSTLSEKLPDEKFINDQVTVYKSDYLENTYVFGSRYVSSAELIAFTYDDLNGWNMNGFQGADQILVLKSQTETYQNLTWNECPVQDDASGPTYTAGANINIDANNEISATYSAFVGASVSSDGDVGLVPKPYIGDEDKCLKGDGTWGAPTIQVDDETLQQVGGMLKSKLQEFDTIEGRYIIKNLYHSIITGPTGIFEWEPIPSTSDILPIIRSTNYYFINPTNEAYDQDKTTQLTIGDFGGLTYSNECKILFKNRNSTYNWTITGPTGNNITALASNSSVTLQPNQLCEFHFIMWPTSGDRQITYTIHTM